MSAVVMIKHFLTLTVLIFGFLLAGCQGDNSSSSEIKAKGNILSGSTSSRSEDANASSRSSSSRAGGDRTINHKNIFLNELTDADVLAAKSSLHVVYEHTSHGSQLITGMESLAGFREYSNRYAWSDVGEGDGLDLDDRGIPADVSDLSQGDSVDNNGDTPWVIGTRALLDDPANTHVNVVMWSWCSINGHDAQRYLDNMEKLISEYPGVTFVFMTGHAEGLGEDLSINGVHYNNALIRAHAEQYQRWLYDFADIEGYDPDGAYYWDRDMRDNLRYDEGNWAEEWVSANSTHDYAHLTMGDPAIGFTGTYGCAHSDYPQESNINCIVKAAAAWHLFARIANSGN